MDLIAYITILITSFCDGIRDGEANISRKASWIHWHIVKWVAFYSPILLIIILINYSILEIVSLAFFSWLLWRLGYKMRLPRADS